MEDGNVLFISESGVVRAALPPDLGHYFRLNK
jgi:hypothetical protein